MSAPEALIVAASGFLVVFLMLCLLWMIIVCINKVVTAVEGHSKKTAPAAPAPVEEVKAEKPKEHVVYGGELALYDVDEKTAACIMAIVADQTKIPLDQLVFRSIRAID